jgi:alpha-glucuronidase
MHHVPYTHRLRSGKTVIQHIYDSHYEGAEAAEDLVQRWRTLQGRVDEQRYGEVLVRLEYQAGHARVWRDAVNTWFLKTSGIPDERGRAGHFPNRTEAESMQLSGYETVAVTPWEAASGARAVRCAPGAGTCSATLTFQGRPGQYDASVQYFDQNNGVARYRLLVGRQVVDEWTARDDLPTTKIDAHSSTRRRTAGLALRPGDEIRIEGEPDGGDLAGLDYLEITPSPGP